ncbi:Regulator Of Nonsense Transcripts 3B [Manis pentadactyla]|nr:Regulator Of Nonsense Transcripts 3B [Manis pentadactyla]
MDHLDYKTHEKKMNKVSRQRARGKGRKELALYQPSQLWQAQEREEEEKCLLIPSESSETAAHQASLCTASSRKKSWPRASA